MNAIIAYSAILIAAALGIGVATNFNSRRAASIPVPSRIEQEDAKAIIKALTVLGEVAPASIGLSQLADAVDSTPATIALGLAGNPSVSWEAGRDKVRYYHLSINH